LVPPMALTGLPENTSPAVIFSTAKPMVNVTDPRKEREI
jgi:hypothetical protein